MMNETAHRLPGLLVLFCLIVAGNCSPQDKIASAQTTDNVRERVNTIIAETIQRGEFTTPEGVRGITRVPPLAEHVEEIKRYGDRAVEPLEGYFYSANVFECQVAMRLMGALGGKRIIEPFKKVILYDPSAVRREYALRGISQGPWDEAAKVITHAAENDWDPNVRKVAQELLDGHGP